MPSQRLRSTRGSTTTGAVAALLFTMKPNNNLRYTKTIFVAVFVLFAFFAGYRFGSIRESQRDEVDERAGPPIIAVDNAPLANSASDKTQSEASDRLVNASQIDLLKLSEIQDSVERRYLTKRSLDGLSFDAIASNLPHLNEIDETVGSNDSINAVWYRLGELNGSRAMGLLSEVPEEKREELVMESLSGWVSMDPSGAWAWVNDNATDYAAHILQSRARFDRLVEGSTVSGDLQVVAENVMELPEGPFRASLIAQIVDKWIDEDRDAAMSWIREMPEGISRMKTWRKFVDSWIEENPVEALDFVMKLPEADRWPVLEVAIPKWARNSGPSAPAQWLNKYPLSPELDRTVFRLTIDIAKSDPEAAFTWMKSISNDSTRDRTISAVSNYALRKNPKIRLEWVEHATNQELRTRLLFDIAAQWEKDDHDSLFEYLNDVSNLSENEMRLIRDVLNIGNE